MTGAGRQPGILFLCVHNAGRSQMAAAFARHMAGGAARIVSAGSEPAATVNPAAVEAMAEVGIDIASERPARWDLAEIEAVDVVVTMGCGDECPVVPGTEYVDWPLTDPAGQSLAVVREVRDEIESRVRGLLADLGVRA